MSKHRQEKSEDQMPLPSPRSPRALDEKILAHARAHVPPKRSPILVGWTGGLATAAVLVMAVYLTTMTTAIKEPVPPSAPLLKEEHAAGAAAPASLQTAAKRKTASQPDFDSVERIVSEQEKLQMAPVAEMATSDAFMHERKVLEPAKPNIQTTLDHLQTLLEDGDVEAARLGYTEFLNACGECDLPDTLEQALADRHR